MASTHKSWLAHISHILVTPPLDRIGGRCVGVCARAPPAGRRACLGAALRRRSLGADQRGRHVHIVRGEGRDMSNQYGGRDETCPLCTGGRGGGARSGRGLCVDQQGGHVRSTRARADTRRAVNSGRRWYAAGVCCLQQTIIIILNFSGMPGAWSLASFIESSYQRPRAARLSPATLSPPPPPRRRPLPPPARPPPPSRQPPRRPPRPPRPGGCPLWGRNSPLWGRNSKPTPRPTTVRRRACAGARGGRALGSAHTPPGQSPPPPRPPSLLVLSGHAASLTPY